MREVLIFSGIAAVICVGGWLWEQHDPHGCNMRRNSFVWACVEHRPLGDCERDFDALNPECQQ